MKISFECFEAGTLIPVSGHLRNRKLRKYFSRETAAAIVAVSKLLNGRRLPAETPFYYATGLVEYEEYGLPGVVSASLDRSGAFSERLFVEQAMARISPLTSFKVLQNMTLAFVSIEQELVGDNAVVCVSAATLLSYALTAPWEGEILVGAGKVFHDGKTTSGFALMTQGEAMEALTDCADITAIDLFQKWSAEGA